MSACLPWAPYLHSLSHGNVFPYRSVDFTAPCLCVCVVMDITIEDCLHLKECSVGDLLGGFAVFWDDDGDARNGPTQGLLIHCSLCREHWSPDGSRFNLARSTSLSNCLLHRQG